MPRVLLEGLTKVFENPRRASPIRALSELNLQVEEGECLVLVGPSGSGKTTALRLIAGLEVQTSGTVRIGETVVNDLEPKARDVAMVFQNPALYPHLSVFENMALGLKLRNYPRAQVQQRITDVARMLDITEHLNARPMELSGGQRQRAAIGRAIARRASVLLLDEPLANVEPNLRARLRLDLARLRKEYAITMLYVTHDHSDALIVGNRVAVLQRGVLQQVADPTTLYLAPANLFVAGFIGSPPMNLFRGTLRQNGSQFAFEPDSEVQAVSPSKHYTSPFIFPAPLIPKLHHTLGRPMVLGIRPERVQLDLMDNPDRPRWTLKASIVSIENAGADKFVHATGYLGTFVARVSSTTRLQINEESVFSLDLDQVRLFDPATGAALL